MLIPYEQEKGMDAMKQALEKTAPGQKIAVFIGPEGGFDEGEIRQALEMGVCPVSLGSRILRTETAGLAILSGGEGLNFRYGYILTIPPPGF